MYILAIWPYVGSQDLIMYHLKKLTLKKKHTHTHRQLVYFNLDHSWKDLMVNIYSSLIKKKKKIIPPIHKKKPL